MTHWLKAGLLSIDRRALMTGRMASIGSGSLTISRRKSLIDPLPLATGNRALPPPPWTYLVPDLKGVVDRIRVLIGLALGLSALPRTL